VLTAHGAFTRWWMPITALLAWLGAAGIPAGPVFRSLRRGGGVGERPAAQSVAEIVKAYFTFAVVGVSKRTAQHTG